MEERIHLVRAKIAGVAADFEMATFLDTGQVFNDFNDVFKDYRMTPGIGFGESSDPMWSVESTMDIVKRRRIFAGLDFPY